MKRFLVFAGERFYPQGGAWDLFGAAETLDEAMNLARTTHEFHFNWSNILDTSTGKVYVHGEDYS